MLRLVVKLTFLFASLSITVHSQNNNVITLKVDNTDVIISDFLGVNGVYHGFSFMPEQETEGMGFADREREFDRVHRMKLNIARTWYRPDFACGDNIYNDFDWESAKMKAFYLWLNEMKRMNVDVALQAGWWFTYDTHMGNPSSDTENDPQRFAEWISESLRYMIVEKGFDNIKYVHLFTEPMNWDGDGSKPGNLSISEYYRIVSRKVHEQLIKTGIRSKVKLVGPNFGSTDKADWVQWSMDNLGDVFDIISWHTYNGIRNSDPPAEYDGWLQTTEVGAKMVRPSGKQYWIDEYGCTYENVRSNPDYGNYLAQAVAAFCNAGVQTSFIWILFDQQYVSPRNQTNNGDSFVDGVHRWGLAKWPHDKLQNPTHPYPAWYSYSMMSRYLGGRNNTVVFNSPSNTLAKVYIVCTKNNDGDMTVLVVNGNHTPQNVKVEFSEALNNVTFNRHLFDPANVTVTEDATIPGIDKQIKGVRSSFSDVLPSRGVAIYTTRKD